MKHIFLIGLLAVISCNSKEEFDNSEKKKEPVIALMKQRGVIDWSNLRNKEYTLDFKDALNSPYQFISSATIRDIYEKQGGVYAEVETGAFPEYSFTFEVRQEIAGMLLKKDVMLLVKVDDIRKVKEDRIADVFAGTGKILKVIPVE
jgi:hypothetical protein